MKGREGRGWRIPFPRRAQGVCALWPEPRGGPFPESPAMGFTEAPPPGSRGTNDMDAHATFSVACVPFPRSWLSHLWAFPTHSESQSFKKELTDMHAMDRLVHVPLRRRGWY